MNLHKEQAKGYLEEAFLTLESARAISEKSTDEKPLWAQVVKTCYDAMEQAISAAIAINGEIIPKEHPEKIMKFIEIYGRENEIVQRLLDWLGKRAKAQYVDVTKGTISIPHKAFNKNDSELALKDAEKVIKKIRLEIKKLII